MESGSFSCVVLGRWTRWRSHPNGWWMPARRLRHPMSGFNDREVSSSVIAHSVYTQWNAAPGCRDEQEHAERFARSSRVRQRSSWSTRSGNGGATIACDARRRSRVSDPTALSREQQAYCDRFARRDGWPTPLLRVLLQRIGPVAPP